MPARLVSVELARAIRQLKSRLLSEFGNDFSFTVMGKGELVAANDLSHGNVEPSVLSFDHPEGHWLLDR